MAAVPSLEPAGPISGTFNRRPDLPIEHKFDRFWGMAGGMNRRGAFRRTLYERIHGQPLPAEPPSVRHCWVIGEHDRLPGLLLEWRRTAAGWQGRVVHPRLDGTTWELVEEWLGADRLEAS